MSNDRGKLLEGAIVLAAKEYQRAGKADIFHRPTPKIFKGGKAVFTATAGVDFNGSVEGRAVTFDAKETHEASLPLANIEDHQLETLRRNRAGLSGLIVAFLPAWDCYWLPIAQLDEFYAAKWRESLSRDWCRAFGLSLPVECRPSLRRKDRFVRHVRFLDGAPHADRDHAIARVNAERLTSRRQPELFGEVVHPYEEAPPKPSKFTERVDPFGAEAWERSKRMAGKEKKWGSR